MSKSYVDSNIDQIMNDQKYDYPLNCAMVCSWLMANVKGENLKILDVSELSSFADYFILGTFENTMQLNAVASSILYQAKRFKITALSKEGLENSDWCLIDLGDVVVHIFVGAGREMYGLDEIWSSAKSIAIPENFYFSTPYVEHTQKENIEEYETSNNDDEGYF